MKMIKYLDAKEKLIMGYCHPFGDFTKVNYSFGLWRALITTFHECYHYIFSKIKKLIPNPYIEDPRVIRIYDFLDFLSDLIHYVPLLGNVDLFSKN